MFQLPPHPQLVGSRNLTGQHTQDSLVTTAITCGAPEASQKARDRIIWDLKIVATNYTTQIVL